MKVELRDYQVELISEIESQLIDYNVLAVCPCGSGKTVIAAEIIRLWLARSQRIVFLAHARELVMQCTQKLADLGIYYGIIMAGKKPSLLPDVQVGSIQTLSRRLIRKAIQSPPADLIIIDEAHHSNAVTYQNIVEGYPAARVLGLTATPQRTDGRGLGV